MSRRRLTLYLAAVYSLPAAAWVIFARRIVPPLIRDAYHGRSLPALNRVFRGRIPHPLGHYYDLWRAAWGALLLAWMFHLVVVLVVLGTDRWFVGGRPREEGQGRDVRAINRWLIASALAFLLFTVASGPRQDYVAYLEVWTGVIAGRDPWRIHETWGYPLNAYGPLFNLLALPAWCNPMAPKLLFALAYCLFAVVFLKRGMAMARSVAGTAAGTGMPDFPAWGLLAWLLSPFAWVEVAYFGHFDVLAAIACVAAVALVRENRAGFSGACLAIGFLLKLIPAVIVPFFALDGRHVRVRLLLGVGLPTVFVYGSSLLLWGPSTFRPFAFAYQRGSTLLSIFRYLRGAASPLRRIVEDPNLDAWSTPCLAVAGLSVFLICQWRRTDPATSALVAVLTTLLFYQVGFLQYQMILFLLTASWMGRHATDLARHRGLAVAIVGYFGWLTLFDLFYCYAGGILHAVGPWGRVEDWVGLPNFLLGSLLLVNLLRVAGRLRVL